jgi:hypothetical protein
MLTFKRAGAALALMILLLPAGVEAGGWYLMEAPPQAYLDSSCRNGGWPTWRDYFSALRTGGKVSEARMFRCFVEMFTVSTAPLSEWMQMTAPSGTAVSEDQSAFQELKDCELARNLGAGMPPVHLGYSDITAWLDKLDVEKLGGPDLAKMVAKMDAEGAKTGSLSGTNGAEVDPLKKGLPILEDFERKHPENYRLRAMIFLIKDGLATASPSARAGNERCIASDDPRLKEE